VVRLTVASATSKAYAGLLISLQLVLLIPLGTLDDHTQPQLNPATLGFMLLSLQFTPTIATLTIDDPLGDRQ